MLISPDLDASALLLPVCPTHPAPLQYLKAACQPGPPRCHDGGNSFRCHDGGNSFRRRANFVQIQRHTSNKLSSSGTKGGVVFAFSTNSNGRIVILFD